jgi:hypothetical protein
MTKITLTAGGPPRTRVQVAEAEEILARFQQTIETRSQHANDAGDDDDCKASVQVHTLNLSRRQWPLESLQVLTPVLEAIASQVVILKVDDIITGLETDDGLASLAFLADIFSKSDNDDEAGSSIQEIDLSDNALGTRGSAVLNLLLQLTSLQRLYFNNCGLSAESFSESLLPILQINTLKWTALGLSGNQFGPAGAKEVGQLLQLCIHLESFSYGGTGPQLEGTRDICQGLQAMTVAATAAANSKTPTCSLQSLDLNACTFRSGDEAVGPCLTLCQCLQASPALCKLVLRNVELEVAGLRRVLHSVQLSGARLQVLDLGATGAMADEGAAVLQAYLEGTGNGANAGAARHLLELSFDSNDLTHAGFADLVASFTAKECCLCKLNLADYKLEIAGVRVLLDNPIPTLQEVNLTENPGIPLQLAVKLQAMYPTAAHPAVKANQVSRKKEADTSAHTVVTVGAVDHPHSFLKVIRKHFLKYITTDAVALRLLITHEVLDDILREHRIQLGNELLDADNMSSESKEIITPWLELLFQDSFAIAKDIDPRKDVICGSNRPSRTLIEIVKQNSHHGNGKQTQSKVVEQIVEQLFEKGIRFLLYMAVGIHFILDKRDPDVKERVRKTLENQQRNKRSQSKKIGTKPSAAAACTAARVSTSLASAAKISTSKSRARREGRPPSYEDPDESPPLIKCPKLEHNPDLTDIKIGSKIAVYWAGDHCYYGGEVTKYRQGDNGERTSFYVDYDDGQDEWVGMCCRV